MVSFCAVCLHAESFQLCYSFVPNESISSYGQSWQGLVDAAIYFIKQCKVCESLTSLSLTTGCLEQGESGKAIRPWTAHHHGPATSPPTHTHTHCLQPLTIHSGHDRTVKGKAYHLLRILKVLDKRFKRIRGTSRAPANSRCVLPGPSVHCL